MRIGKTSVLICMAVFCAALCAAGQLPDKFQNLQVLPKDIPKDRLIATMVKFSLGTGLRCEECHVGEGGPELKNMDFPADDKPTKTMARAMLRMVQAINQDFIAKLGRDKPIQVGCETCHHGVRRPQPVETIVAETLDQQGAAAAAAQYRALRNDNLARGAYDFTRVPLDQLGESLISRGRAKDAAALLELNVEFNPNDWRGIFLLGEAYRSAGDLEKARANYQKALDLNPNNARAKARLEELKAPPR
jgi:hypothetical protein